MALPDPTDPTDRFPVEIYESIIGHVALQDDYSRTSIKLCSLVSRTFLPLARAHLFYDITLNSIVERGGGFQSFSRLIKISDTPEIAQYVQSLNYYARRIDWPLDSLTKAFTTFTRLNGLAIYNFNLNWIQVPLTLRVVLPSLSRLELVYIRDFHLPDLAICSGLKSLSIRNVFLSAIDPIPIVEKKLPLQLEEYCTALSDDITTQLCAASRVEGTHMIDFSVLHTVVLHVDRRVVKVPDGFNMLFKRCIQVTRIIVSADPRKGYSMQRPILKGFADVITPSLRTLRHLEVTFPGSQMTDFGLAAELEALSSENIIESIEIEVFYDRDRYYKRGGIWFTLDKVLTRDPMGWRNLKTFSLSFEVSPAVSFKFKKALRKLPKIHFKGLMASKSIQFNFSIKTL